MDFLEEYIKDCRLRNLEKRTIESYKSSVKSFLQFCPHPARATKYDVMEYLRHLQNKGVRMSTIHRDFSAISGLYEYLIFCDAVTVNPVKQIKSRYLNQPEEPERRFIPEVHEMRRLLATVTDCRDKAMILFLAKTAGRRGEFLTTQLQRAGMQETYIQWLRGDSLKKETWKSNYLKMDAEIIRDEFYRCAPPLL